MTEGASEYGIRISRVFDAPRERVWREWTEPARFADWYGGPQCEVPLDSVSMDVRPGGKWRLTMFAPPDRRRIDWKGEYLEVVAPERLIFTVSDQRGDDAYELVKVVLTPLGDERTEMLFEQRGSMSPEQYERATKIIQENRDTLVHLADALLEHESLDSVQIRRIVAGLTIDEAESSTANSDEPPQLTEPAVRPLKPILPPITGSNPAPA